MLPVVTELPAANNPRPA
jgi:hypothetical protein